MTLARKASRRPSEPGWIYQKEAGVMLTFLKSERTIDYLRWTAAFVAVVLTYGVTAWMVLRPAGWRLDADGPVVEINLRDMPQTPAIPPSDRASEPATDPTGDNAQRALSDSADTAPRVAGASASRADAGRDADTDAKDGSPDAPKTAALDEAENPSMTQPWSSADTAAEAPAKTEAPAADSGGGGRPTTIPPGVVTPDTSAAASIARAPIDTSITVNQGRSLLRSAKGHSQFSALPLPQLKLTPPLATLKDRNEPFAKKPPPVAGLTLQAIAPAANRGHADFAQKPAMGDDGGIARNPIGVVIAHHTVMPQAGAPLGIRPLPGAMPIAMQATGEHSSATTPTGVPLAANNAKPSDATAATNQWRPGHAGPIASIGGPAINGTGMSRPATTTGAAGALAKAPTGGLNGSSFRTKYR
jgi:hypothetical protein